MPILLGIRPGGRDGFAVVALFWTGRPPVQMIAAHTLSGVQAVTNEIMGVVGEWGELTAATVDAPLTWSGTPTGRREADDKLRALVPSWVPKTWFRSPNALPGAVAVQGPAVTWALAVEAKRGNIPVHKLLECHSRASLARTVPELKASVLGYRSPKLSRGTRQRHVERLLRHLSESGNVKFEVNPPKNAEELEALVCAMTALAIAFPESGLVAHEVPGSEIRPVGRRNIAILDALS